MLINQQLKKQPNPFEREVGKPDQERSQPISVRSPRSSYRLSMNVHRTPNMTLDMIPVSFSLTQYVDQIHHHMIGKNTEGADKSVNHPLDLSILEKLASRADFLAKINE